MIINHTPTARPIENFSGHSIRPYRIHGGKSLLLVRDDDPKMEERNTLQLRRSGLVTDRDSRGHISSATLSAIFEPRGTEGKCFHYAKTVDAPNVPVSLTDQNQGFAFTQSLDPLPKIFARSNVAKGPLKTISKEFVTLKFCRRYLDRPGEKTEYLFPVTWFRCCYDHLTSLMFFSLREVGRFGRPM